jgi:glutathione S-transferase
MDLVIVVVVLILIEYIAFGILVGRARGKYGIDAPAVSGDPVFERYYRVQQNTAEQLLAFLPAIFLYTHLGNTTVAAGLGLVFFVGRIVYLRSYVADPKSRGLGFGLSFLPTAFMLIASLIIAVGNLAGM